jgi:putative membrane protein
MFEVESSKIALSRSKDQRTRQFADMMIKDHTKTSNELKALVKKMEGIKVPASADAEHQKKIKQLQSATGAQFEQQYRAMQIEGHETAVKLFEGYAQSGDNSELKAWAEKTLPHLRTHLQHAQALPQGGQAPVVSEAPTQPKGKAAKGKGARDVSAMASPGPNHILASSLRGTRIYGANDENIGDVNDIVLDRSGRVAAVVVGVGGFLGQFLSAPWNSLVISGAKVLPAQVDKIAKVPRAL